MAATSIPVQKAEDVNFLRGTLTVVSPVIVHLRGCRLSMMISPAKGEKSLDMLHSTEGKGRGGGVRSEERRRRLRQDSVTGQAVLQEMPLIAPPPPSNSL